MSDPALTQEVLSAIQSLQGDIFSRRDDPNRVRDVIRETLDETFSYMFTDIEREIHLAEEKNANGVGCCEHYPGGGNYLAALGLLSYTEYMGSWITGTYGMGTGRRNFTIFFKLMGAGYAGLADTVNVYDVFRNGMAHRYTPKKFCDVHMLGTTLDPAPDCGIVRSHAIWPEYHFIVSRYFRDFQRVCNVLYDLTLQFPAKPAEVKK